MSDYLLTLTKHYAKNPDKLKETLALAQSATREYEETQRVNEENRRIELEFRAKVDAENRKRAAALQPRLVIQQGKEGLEAVDEPRDSYTRFLEAQKKKADYNLEAFSLVDTAMAAFDPKKAEKIRQATEQRNRVDATLSSVLAADGKNADRSFGEALADAGKSVQATVYDMVGTVSDAIGTDITGLEDKGIKPSHLMAAEATEKALDLLGKGRDFVAETAGMNKESSDILKLFYNTEGAKEVVSSKLAAARNLQVKENQRRAKEGLPSIEEENAANPFNRYADFSRQEADKVRQDKTLASKVNDARLGVAIKSGFSAVAKEAMDNPSVIIEKAVESAPYLVAGGPVSSTLRALGFSEAVATAGGAIAIGSMDTAQGAQQAKDAVKTVNMTELAKSDAFRQLQAANPEATPEQLREVLAMAAEERALGVGLPVTALLGVVSTKLGLNPVEAAASGAGKRVTAMGAGGAMVREAVGEFPEEGGNQWSQNLGEIAGGVRDPSKEMENVVGAGTVGAFTGAATSGGVSAVQVGSDLASKESVRRTLIKRENEAAKVTSGAANAPVAQQNAAPAQTAGPAAVSEPADTVEDLIPVPFFERKLDEVVSAQNEALPEGKEERDAFVAQAKQEYKQYLEDGTPMSQDTAELVNSFLPDYKAAVAPKPQEEVDAGVQRLVSDIFAINQAGEGQSLGTVNARVVQRISGETSHQVLEKFAELQATKAASAGNTRASRVFSSEAEAANIRAQQLKKQLQAPAAPPKQTAESDTLQQATNAELSPGARVNQIRKELRTLKAEVNPSQETVSKIAALEQERDAIYSSRGFAAPKAKAPVVETKTKTEEAPVEVKATDADTAYNEATKQAKDAERKRKEAQLKLERDTREAGREKRRTKTKGKAQTLLNMLGKKRLFTSEYSEQVGNKDNFRVGGNWAHTNSTHTGMTLHHLREWMEEQEFLPMGSYDGDALDLYTRAINGEDIYNFENEAAAAYEREAESMARELDDNLLRQKQEVSDLIAEEKAANERREAAWQNLKKSRMPAKPAPAEDKKVSVPAETTTPAAMSPDETAVEIGNQVRDLKAKRERIPQPLQRFIWRFITKNPEQGVRLAKEFIGDDVNGIFGSPVFELAMPNNGSKGYQPAIDLLHRLSQSDARTAPWAIRGLERSNLSGLLNKPAPPESSENGEQQDPDTLQSATSAMEGSVSSPRPTAKRFKDMTLFEQWAIAGQLRDTTSSRELNSILAGIASGSIMLRFDPATAAEGVIFKDNQKFVINLAQFTGKNLKDRKKKSKELRKEANRSLTIKDRLSRKAKKEKLQAFYLKNFTALVQSSTSFTDALRHEMTHAKDLMSGVDMQAVNEMMANNPLWAAATEYVNTNPATKNRSENDRLLETNGYYMTALSAMASNPAYAPLLATFEEAVYAPMKELTAFMSSEELMQHWASVLDSHSTSADTLQSNTGRTLTLPQANRNKRLKALLEQKITSTELPKGPLKAEAVVDTSPGKPDRAKSVSLQLNMLLEAKDAISGKTRADAVAALQALRDSDKLSEYQESNILATIAEDTYASRTIMEATSGMVGEDRRNYTMLLSDLFNDRDVSLSTMMTLPVYNDTTDKQKLAPLWTASGTLRSRLLGAVGGIATIAEMGEAFRSDIRVSEQENNNPNIVEASIGSIMPSIKDGTLLNGTTEATENSVRAIVAAARAKSTQHRDLVVVRAKKLAKARVGSLAALLNNEHKKLRVLNSEIDSLTPLKDKRDKFLAGLKKQPARLSSAFDKLNKLPELEEARDKILASVEDLKAKLKAAKLVEETVEGITPATEMTLELADVITKAHNSSKSAERSLSYEFKNAVELETAGQRAIDNGGDALKAFLNSAYITVSNPKEGIESFRVFVSEEEASTNKDLVQVNGKYYDLNKAVDAAIKAENLNPARVKKLVSRQVNPVYVRFLFDTALAISIANDNAPVLPSYADSYGRRQLFGPFEKAEYLDTWTGAVVETEQGYVAFAPDTIDMLSDPSFIAMYKSASESSAAAAKPRGVSGEKNVFTLAEEKATDLKGLDDVLTDELQELENLNDDVEALLSLFEDKDYEAEYETFFGEDANGDPNSTEAQREASWWSQAGTMIAFNPGIVELLELDNTEEADSYLGIESSNYESVVAALQKLGEKREGLENKMELVRYQNDVVRTMGYDFDSGNLSESYDLDVTEAAFSETPYRVGQSKMDGKYEYDPSDGKWKKKEEIKEWRPQSASDARISLLNRAKAAEDYAKARRMAAIERLIAPDRSTIEQFGRRTAVEDALYSDYVVRRDKLFEYMNNPSDDILKKKYYRSSTASVPKADPNELAAQLEAVRQRRLEQNEEEQRQRAAVIAAQEGSQDRLFSATGSFSGIFRNVRTRVAADDVNALTAMIADRATLSSLKTAAQNNAFFGPSFRNIINRDSHFAIGRLRMRIDGLMAKNTAVIGGKVARMNQEMDNLGIPQNERTALLDALISLDETYTTQAMKNISRNALINRYKRMYGNEVQKVFDLSDELRQEVDAAIQKLAKATLGQYTYDTAPQKVKNAYDALLASKQRYLHRTYHKFSISSGRLWKAQIDNAIDAIKRSGPTAVANSSSHSAKAHAAVLNAANTIIDSWNAFTANGTAIEHAFKQVAPNWRLMNDEVKLRTVLDMFQADFMAAAELEIANGSIDSISPASRNSGALKNKKLDGPANKVFRELLGENRDYGRVISETIENQTVITMHLEMMRQLQHMGLLVDKNTYDSMTVAQRDQYTAVPSAGIFSAFSSSYVLKDYEYAVTSPLPKQSIAKSIRDFNTAYKNGDYTGMGISAGIGAYNAVATAFGLLKMFTVFTSPNLWASLFVGMASFSAKSMATPAQMKRAYQIAAMWKLNQAGAPIDPNDPMYDDYMFIMGSETIDSAVFAELTTRAKDSDYEAALAQLDTNGRLVRDMGFKTAENVKDYLIASWTKYEAIPKIAAALAHRDVINSYNRAMGKQDVSPAYVGNIVRREFPSAKEVPALAKFTDSIGYTMFAGFYYQTIKAGSWGIAQNLNEGLQMYRNAGDNADAKSASVKFISRVLAGSALQFATVSTLVYLLRALFTMDEDDMDEEQRKLKKAAEGTLYTTEDPDNLMHLGFHEDGSPIFVDVTMMVNPLDVRDALFRRAFDSMSDDNKETLSEVLFDQIPYGLVGQAIRNYMRGMDPGKNANKAYDRLSNAGLLRYVNNLNEFGVAPGEAGTIAGALANISGIKKVDPGERLSNMSSQVFYANKDLSEHVTDVIYDGDSYNKPQMRDQIESELEFADMKARAYFDSVNDAFKRSGMSKSEFVDAVTKRLPDQKAEMAAKDIKSAIVDKGEDYAEERLAYSAKQVVKYYNKEVKKGLLSTEKGGPLYNASTYDVAAATRNKTSYEAIIDPTTPDKPVKATVTSVHDADTIYVTTSNGRQLKVRIQNIDAFELKQKLRDGSLDIGQEGQRYLSSLVNKKQVTLFGYGYDNNGRMIARVLTKDGRDAGTVVAEQGYAILTDISDLEDYPTKAEGMDAVAPSVYRERNP